jgi:hypothetical protein
MLPGVLHPPVEQGVTLSAGERVVQAAIARGRTAEARQRFTRSAARVSAWRFVCVEEQRSIGSGFYVAG